MHKRKDKGKIHTNRRMYLKLNKTATSYFAGVVDIVKDLANDLAIKIEESGLSIQGMDSSHIAFIDFHMSDYENYKNDEDVTTLGVHMPSLYKVLKLGTGGSLNIESSEDKLHMEFDSSKRQLNVDLTLLDIEAEDFNTEEWEYDTSFKMSAMEFASMCKDISSISPDQNGIKIKVQPDQVTFAATDAQKSTNLEMVFKPNEINVSKETEGLYSVKHLMYFAKASAFTKDLEISVSKEYPLKLTFGGNEDVKSRLNFYLASRIVD